LPLPDGTGTPSHAVCRPEQRRSGAAHPCQNTRRPLWLCSAGLQDINYCDVLIHGSDVKHQTFRPQSSQSSVQPVLTKVDNSK